MIIRKIRLTEYEYQPPINFVAGATEPDIQFQLADYDIPAGATARCYVQRFDGTFEYTVATIDGNNVTVEPTSSMFSIRGEGAIQITLYAGEEVLKNFSVPVFVHADLADENAEQGSDVTGIFRAAEEQALEDFAEDAEAKAAEVIESIPVDYTALTEEVDELNERLDDAPKISTPEETEADLYICDAQGNVIGMFVDGHIVTKNFDSRNAGMDMIMDADSDEADLYICDSFGNVVVEFKDGHVVTKNFDSADFAECQQDVEALSDEIAASKRVRTRMEFGAHNGAEYYAPECTIPAYRIAGQQGWEWAWIAGIAFSSEGSMYVIHDDTVDRTTDGTGYISQMTDAQIDALTIDQTGPGYDLADFDPAELKIPTLEQVIQQCVRYGMKMVLRLSLFPNDDSTVDGKAKWDALVDLINGYGIKPQDISCYVDSGTKAATCRRLFGDDVEISTFQGSSATAQTYVTWFSDRSLTGTLAAIINVSNLDLAAVKLLHSNGIRVYAYNSVSVDVASNCATMGVDVFQNSKIYKLTE